MRVEILGSAAGGGFPQWNCGCGNCSSMRSGTLNGKSRTQTQVAVSGDGDSWFLLDASPDLRLQIENCPRLYPRHPGRSSPIAGVVVTSADIDQMAGLLSLRELQRFSLYTTTSIRRILREDNSVFGMLNRVTSQVAWVDIGIDDCFPLFTVAGLSAGIRCEAFPLGKSYPAYVRPDRAAQLEGSEASVGLILSSMTGFRLAYLPAVAKVDQALRERLENVDLLLFDGTFWSEDELIQVQGGGATAAQMGHIAVSGPEGTLAQMADLKHPRKVFIHINNTNPMLDQSSIEYASVRAAGWEIAEDGWQFHL